MKEGAGAHLHLAVLGLNLALCELEELLGANVAVHTQLLLGAGPALTLLKVIPPGSKCTNKISKYKQMGQALLSSQPAECMN